MDIIEAHPVTRQDPLNIEKPCFTHCAAFMKSCMRPPTAELQHLACTSSVQDVKLVYGPRWEGRSRPPRHKEAVTLIKYNQSRHN